jgi:hypothetical protein
MKRTNSQRTDAADLQEFDLERYLRAVGGTRPEAFDWSDPGPRLDAEALFCLGYMMDIESHTIIYLRELLSTSVVQDVSITAFLPCWAYEEFFHARVFKCFLEAQGVKIDENRWVNLRRARPADFIAQRFARVLSHITRHFGAVHMTWGAINELTTLTAYNALIEKTRHPLLSILLKRIIKDERRHFAFYFNQARLRLRSRTARWLTTFAVRSSWTPVGAPVRGDADAKRVCSFLFGDPQGSLRVANHDATIAHLPGLVWFDLLSRYRGSMEQIFSH